tara:strand:+ start:2759 stop:3286 length:528 start_codon:yes stop_codon:yes gene_type:complete
MAFLLNGNRLAVDTPFTVGDTKYPANWLRLTTAEEKAAIGITEVEDPKRYDLRFYWNDGTEKEINDINQKDENGDLLKDENGNQVVLLGVKSTLIAQEKENVNGLLSKYDWQVVRKSEKGIDLDSEISTYRDSVRTSYAKRKSEIEACSSTSDLVTLYGGVMTRYPKDPNSPNPT